MFKNLKTLLSIRSWLKSRTLNVAAVLGAIATMDVTAGTGLIQTAIDFMSQTFGWMESTSVAALVALKSLADVVLRAKTDKSLEQK